MSSRSSFLRLSPKRNESLLICNSKRDYHKKTAPNYESLIFTRADNKATSVVTSQGYIIRGGYVAKVKKIKMSYEEIN